MNDDLKGRIEAVREFISRDPQGLIYGMIAEPYADADQRVIHQSYADFLGVCDGARFGAGVQLWGHEWFERAPLSILCPDIDLKEWTPIGEYGDDTLALNNSNATLARFIREGDGEFVVIGDFEDFLDGIFSQRYSSLDLCLGEEMDTWIWALRRTKLI